MEEKEMEEKETEARYGCRGPVLYFIAESKEKAQELYRECLNDEDIECENMED